MADTPTTRAALQTQLPDNTASLILPQNIRNFLVTVAGPAVTLTPVSGAVTWNLATAPVATVTLTQNTTITITGGEDGFTGYRLAIIQGGAGSFTPTLSGTALKISPASPVWNTAAGSFNCTYVDAVTVSGTVNLMVQVITPNVVTPGIRPSLVGISKAMSPAFSASTGYYPDFVIIFCAPDLNTLGGTGDLPSQAAADASGYTSYTGYPCVMAMGTYENGSATGLSSVTSAAAGTYEASWASAISSQVAPYPVYAVRICQEWGTMGGYGNTVFSGTTNGKWGPWAGVAYGNNYASPAVTPTVWVQAWRRLAHQFRLHAPNVKIAWDYPVWAMGGFTPPANFDTAWYPGTDQYGTDVGGTGAYGDLVDIISTDLYFGGPSGPLGGLTVNDGGVALLNFTPYGMTSWATFATGKGKPMAYWETAVDGGILTDGTQMTAACNFITSHNFAAVSWWTASDSGDWPFSFAPANLTSWLASFGSSVIGTTYTGTFFPTWYNPTGYTRPTGF